ncbi:hypothetical protein [Rhodoferax sp.]|uniref:hypothetical protein n=1 Tax=Rhodoferax sp. TaxID=50421 RepID=UPI001EC300DB|nr:hypothetical protein [Rhodoferax sp.]MBT9504984.1 hypothetical protein [Rhodoferax sp.]
MNVQHLLPRLTLHRQFAEDLWAAKAPCFALGMVEERQEPMGLLALRPPKAMPKEAMALGFNFGHALVGNADFEVVQLFFEFYGFATYSVLLNPSNPLVQKVLSHMLTSKQYFFLAIAPDATVTAFRAEFGADRLADLREHWPRLQNSRTNDLQYQKAVRTIQKQTQAPDALLTWVCRDHVDCLDPRKDPLELTSRGAQAPQDKNRDERLAIAQLLDAKMREFERTDNGNQLELLAQMAPYMELFQQLMQSAQKEEMNVLCEAHPALDRFVQLLARIAQGIQSGAITVPR